MTHVMSPCIMTWFMPQQLSWHMLCHNMAHHNTWCHATSYAIACHAMLGHMWCTMTYVMPEHLMLYHDTCCVTLSDVMPWHMMLCHNITWCYAMTHNVRCWQTNWCSAPREMWLKTKLCMKRLNILTHSKWNCKIDIHVHYSTFSVTRKPKNYFALDLISM